MLKLLHLEVFLLRVAVMRKLFKIGNLAAGYPLASCRARKQVYFFGGLILIILGLVKPGTGLAEEYFVIPVAPARAAVFDVLVAECNDLAYLTLTNFLIPDTRPSWLSDLIWPTYSGDGCGALRSEHYLVQQQLESLDYRLTYADYLEFKRRQRVTHSGSDLATPQVTNSRQQSFNNAYQVLSVFLQTYPELLANIESAAGFAVFETTSFNAVLYAGGWGSGVVFDKVNHNMIYVGTFRAGTGLGLGYINEYVLIIFHKHFAIEQYFGSIVGGDVGASATVGLWSKSMSFNPTISSYRLYNYGANLQGNWGASLYWVMPFLN